MAEQQSQGMGKNLVLAAIVVGGTLFFILFLGKSAETNAVVSHHMIWPWQ
jgi:hypothetical protein